MGATRTSCMIAFILAGAAYLTAAMGFTGIPSALAEWISGLQHAALGAAQRADGVLHRAWLFPRRHLDGGADHLDHHSAGEKAGFDLIWFGIYIVLVVEMAQITPPVGFNLYVLQGMTGRNIFTIGAYALPLFILMCVAVVLVAVFPGIALWLPSTMLDVK